MPFCRTAPAFLLSCAVLCVSGTALSVQALAARNTHGRVTHSHAVVHSVPRPEVPILEPGVMPDADAEVPAEGHKYSLHLAAMHTGESLEIVYRVGDVYVPEALDKLNHLLRDHRTDEVVQYDPKEFDLLHNLLARLGRPAGVVDVVCGYRSAETNELLREEGPNTGVAEHSQHIQGHAIDIRVPGVQTARLRNTALSLQSGGVGYYPRSQFVHVDVGPVRQWTFGGATRRPRGHKARRRSHA